MKRCLSRLLSIIWCLACVIGCGTGDGPAGPAAPARPAGTPPSVAGSVPAPIARAPVVPSFADDVAPLIERYCLGCHEGSSAPGGVILNGSPGQVPRDKDRSRWLRVADVLRSGDMPPAPEPRPDAAELETINSWLDAAVFADDRGGAPVALRRLNRAEYNNTIRDLIGLDLRPADEFPSDDVGYGFDNVAEVLSTSPILLEQYLAAADRVVGEAFRSPEARRRITDPPADTVAPALRRFKPPVRSYPDKSIYVPKKVVRDPELEEQQRVYDILRAFADRAFRRPATHDELTRLVGIIQSAQKDGEGREPAIRLALQAVLMSPYFLYRIGPGCDQGSSDAPLPENDFDLAARLSYFLWSSMPDEELFGLASRAALRRGDVLRSQVMRMLRDPKSRALAGNFSGQWLQTRALKEFTPDPTLFPDFDEPLRAAMVEETELFFRSIQDEDRSVLLLLDADYTFVNDRLARHYGIAGVDSQAFRRVSLSGTARGGVLTQASVLAVTSNPTRTSPAKRGKWILENVLGAPPPPPPSGVEALERDHGAGLADTLRQRMERHRREPRCASCHRRMDPLGFGLENFDAVGGWRTHEGGRPIDPSGELPGMGTFRGPAELKALLSSRREAFCRCLAEKMLTYATGRGLRRSDRRDVDRIVARLAEDEYRFSTLVLAIAESGPFRQRDGRSDGP